MPTGAIFHPVWIAGIAGKTEDAAALFFGINREAAGFWKQASNIFLRQIFQERRAGIKGKKRRGGVGWRRRWVYWESL